MKNIKVMLYLSSFKSLVDTITAIRSHLDTMSIILYILNELPSTYQTFNTIIHTKLTSINLEDLYLL